MIDVRIIELKPDDVLLLEGIGDPQEAHRIAEALRRVFPKHKIIHGNASFLLTVVRRTK